MDDQLVHSAEDVLAMLDGLLADNCGSWVCFRPEGGGGLSDQEVYERRGLAGGLGYSQERLLALWASRLEVLQLRQMSKAPEQAKRFGEDFLWVLLARKPDPVQPGG